MCTTQKLKKHLAESVSGIGKHNETLKSLLEDAGVKPEKEHCKGMEGLCKEALKHGVQEAPKDGELKDIVIIGQYQRMCHMASRALAPLLPMPRRSA